MRQSLIILLVILFAVSISAARRDASKVRQDRQKTEQEIAEVTRRLDRKSVEINSRLNQLYLVEAEIEAYNDSLQFMQTQISATARDIASLNDSIDDLNRNLDNMKRKYATAVRKLQSRQGEMNTMSFIFSAESFTQAYRRMRYISQFSKWRKHKSEEIVQSQRQLDTRRARLENMLRLQKDAIEEVAATKKTLVGKHDETDAIVASLRLEEKSLKKLLRQKEKEAQDLDSELERIIAEEQRKAEEARLAEEKRLKEEAERARLAEEKRQKEEAEKARLAEEKRRQEQLADQNKPAEDKQPEKKTETPAKDSVEKQSQPKSEYELIVETSRKLTGSFEQNKGRLLVPVTGQYKIVRKFGRQSHPTLKYIKTDNSGIDIEAWPGGKARAVFNGRVSAIFRQPGFNNIVMIRHGSYITIYANITAMTVKKGDTVKAGDIIGDIYSDPDDNNRSILHFEIRHEREKLNPEYWIK